MYAGPEVWHEAAHAVVAHWQGAVVRCVTLETDDDEHEGLTEVAWVGLTADERARRSALVALAGPVAEVLETDVELHDPSVLSTWRADWDESTRCLAALGLSGGALELERARLIGEVRVFLSDLSVRERLARVVDQLDAHRTLDETLFDDALG